MITTVTRPASEMTVVELRSYAQSLGIKNVKTYKKEELLDQVCLKLMTSIDTEPYNFDVTKTEIVSVREFSYDTSKTFIENAQLFCNIMKDTDFSKEELSKLFFEKAEEEGFSYDESDMKKFYKIYENTKGIVLIKKSRKNVTKRIYVPKEKPELGTQSRTIYETILQHPSWSHYKIASVLQCTYTNVRRVFKSYIENKVEGYTDCRAKEYFKKQKRGENV